MKKIIVKVGTNVITHEDGSLNLSVMEHLVEQIVALQKRGTEIILVSSGAMGAGHGLVQLKKNVDTIAKRQVLAAVGQVKLMERYLAFFQKHSSLCAQVLVTKEDFRDRTHYLNMKQCFDALLNSAVVPVVNENDVVSVDELMFTDNDELASLISCMVGVEELIILTNVEGMYDKNPTEKNSQLIHKVALDTPVQQFIVSVKSSFGRGGMLTKAKITKRLASMGIRTFIANGRRKNVLGDIVAGKEVGTEFIPAKKKTSSLKRWIASSEGSEKGMVTINERAEKILKENIASLLPVGITKIKGQFRKGDMLKIQNMKGEGIGYGIAAYASTLAKKWMGQKGKKALIHYDYLFLKK